MSQKTLDEFMKEKMEKINKNIIFYKETEFKETPIGKIPKDWNTVRLEEICTKIKAGGTPSTSKKEFWNGNIPFVKIEDITSAGKYLNRTNTSISELGLKNTNAWIVPEKSLLLAMYGSIGEVAINTIPVATNQAILGIIPKNKDNVEFLYYWYLYFKPNWKKYAKTTTQANLTAHIVKNSIIPLPPPLERKVITEILTTLDNAIEATEKYIEKLERLKHGLMQELLTKGIGHKEFKETPIGKIPKEWKSIKIKEIAIFLRRGKNPKYGISDVVVIKTAHNYPDRIKFEEAPRADPTFIKKIPKDYFLKPGDILINSTGTGSVGRVGFFEGYELPCTVDSHITILRVNQNIVLPKYMFYYLSSPYGFKTLESRAIGSTNQIELYTNAIENIYIPLPPLEEQKYIATILSTIDKWIELEKKRKEKLERLKRGLMDLLLTGKIRVKVKGDQL